MASGLKEWANSRLLLFADLRPDNTCMSPSDWTADHGAALEVVAIAVTTGYWLDGAGKPDHTKHMCVYLDAQGDLVEEWGPFDDVRHAISHFAMDMEHDIEWQQVDLGPEHVAGFVEARLGAGPGDAV